jgi:hypothetical protein
MRRLLVLALLAMSVSWPPATAGQPVLAHPGQKVSWDGQVTIGDPGGCDDVTSHGCVKHPLVVEAAKAAWITIETDASYLRVTDRTTYVASNGSATNTRETPSTSSTVTFQQLRSGRVTYTVGVSDTFAAPVAPSPFHVTATLAGKAFDREGECFVHDSGVSALLGPDDGAQLQLRVRLVADPKDAAVVHKAGAALTEIYGRIGITVRVSYDLMHLAMAPTDSYPFEQVKRKYHGERPAGIDVVHVVTDEFSGGYSDCIGGVAYLERGFSTGNAHYNSSGLTGVGATIDIVPAGLIAAHEIGHELGGQHQMVSCTEAAPQQAQHPASDGWTGACTEMGPLALQDSETWSALEKATIRSYVHRYAHP